MPFIDVIVLNEVGYSEAMLGLSLSYNKQVHEMPAVAEKLIHLGGSHVKFLESMVVWLDIIAPRYWWQQFDTYRIGVTKQSESTMHTIMKRQLRQSDFDTDIPDDILYEVNYLINKGLFEEVKSCLPEGFLQRRIVCTNYKVLRHMYEQRHDHRLKHWRKFFDLLGGQLKYPRFVSINLPSALQYLDSEEQ